MYDFYGGDRQAFYKEFLPKMFAGPEQTYWL
jgi:hypothetical protein